jgi:hypothetical protein
LLFALPHVLSAARVNWLEGIHRIQAEAAGAEKGLLVVNLFCPDLQHEVLDHQPFDVLFER